MRKTLVLLHGIDKDKWNRWRSFVKSKRGTIRGLLVVELEKAMEAYMADSSQAQQHLPASQPSRKPTLAELRVDVQGKLESVRLFLAQGFEPRSAQPEWIKVPAVSLGALLAQTRLRDPRTRGRYVQRMIDLGCLKIEPEDMNVFYLSRAWLYPKADKLYSES